MSLLDELKKEEVWQNFYRDRTNGKRLTKTETKYLEKFIEEKRYLQFGGLGLPVKKLISKSGSAKKRVVYSYAEDDTLCLKLLAFLLEKYDCRLSDSCYSFRRGITAGSAFSKIKKIENLDKKYVLKADIANYFNSVPVEKLIEVIKEIIDDDEPLLGFLSDMLRQGRCIYEGETIAEERGAMAGVPTASFFANIYLLSLDRLFEAEKIPYFRYSDDILIICDSEDEKDRCFGILLSHITEKGLALNEKKVKVFLPGEGFEFLGFFCRNGEIDISKTTVDKMKGKISRKARSVYRKRITKGWTYEKAAASFIRSFDNKFYDISGTGVFTWTGFYFPVITVSDGLKIIDAYMLEYLRYLYSGRHCKGNYAISYDLLKKLGYTPLVSEYYTWREDNIKLSKQQ